MVQNLVLSRFGEAIERKPRAARAWSPVSYFSVAETERQPPEPALAGCPGNKIASDEAGERSGHLAQAHINSSAAPPSSAWPALLAGGCCKRREGSGKARLAGFSSMAASPELSSSVERWRRRYLTTEVGIREERGTEAWGLV